MSWEGALQQEKIQHSASRGELLSPTVNDDSYITDISTIAYAVATVLPLLQPSSLTKSLSKSSILYQWHPHIRARNSVSVDIPDKIIVVVHMNGLDSIDSIDVRG